MSIPEEGFFPELYYFIFVFIQAVSVRDLCSRRGNSDLHVERHRDNEQTAVWHGGNRESFFCSWFPYILACL